MRDEVIEQFSDVLQNIEFAIHGAYEKESTLLDLDVLDALDALVRKYAAEDEKRIPPKLRLSGPALRIYTAVEHMCEWRLARGPLYDGDDETMIPQEQRNSVADIVVCLKRIRKSVRIWNEQLGRQGYLDYIVDFFRQLDRRGGVMSSPPMRA